MASFNQLTVSRPGDVVFYTLRDVPEASPADVKRTKFTLTCLLGNIESNAWERLMLKEPQAEPDAVLPQRTSPSDWPD